MEGLLSKGASTSTVPNVIDPMTSTAPPRMASSFFDDVEILNGVSVRRLEPAGAYSKFTCHAFTVDGSRMATGETDGTVSLWSTDDYALLKRAHLFFSTPINCLSFIDDRYDDLIGVDDSGTVIEINFAFPEDIAGPSSERSKGLRTCTRALPEPHDESRSNAFAFIQLSKDGRTLLLSREQIEGGVDLYQLRDTVQHIHLKADIDINVDHCPPNVPGLRRFSFHSFSQSLRKNTTASSTARNHMTSTLQTCFTFPLLSKNGRFILIIKGRLHSAVMHTAVYDVQSLYDEKKSAEPFTFSRARGFWGKGGEYLLLWKDEFHDSPILEVHPTRNLNSNSTGFQRRLGQGLLKWNAQMIESEDVCIAIYTIANSGKQSIQLWDCVLDVVRNDVVLDLTPCRAIVDLALTSNRITADDIVESVGQLKSVEEFVERVMQDAHPTFCVSKDQAWVTVFSRSLHTWTVCSLSSSLRVWNVGIPQDVIFNQFRMRNRVIFDPSYHRLLLLSDATIFTAISPGSSRFCPPDHERFEILSPDIRDVSVNMVDMLVRLPSKALAKLASFLINRRQLHIQCKDHPMQIGSVSDVAFSDLGKQTALVAHADNHLVVLMGSENDFSDALRGRTAWKAKLFPHSLMQDDPGKVYTYSDDQDGESLVVRPIESSPLASFCNLKERSSELVDLGMQTVYEVTQTEDHRRLLMLNDEGVSVVDLHRRRIVECITYSVNFNSVADLRRANSRWMHMHPTEGKEMNERRISEDGRTVLIAWDTKNKKSVVVKPATSYEHCQAMVDDADGSLSDYCTLSRNAEVTLFVDTDALLGGRLVVGIFNESLRRVMRYVEVKDLGELASDEKAQKILESVFYDLTPDGATLVTAVAPVDDQLPLEPCIETFGVNCSEYSISSYSQLVSQREFDAGTSAHQCSSYPSLNLYMYLLVAKFGSSFVDILGAGRTVFQEAVFHQHWDFVKALQDVALKNNIQLTFYNSSAAAEHEFVDFLRDLFSRESSNDILMVIEVIGSKTTPFDQVVKGMTVAFNVLQLKHPDILKTMLSKDYLKRQMCMLYVHVDFMDAKLRHNNAVHIGTSDDYKDWTTIEDPFLLGRRFSEKNRLTVLEMESTGNSATMGAYLIYICIKDAAKVGLQGIIRPLLLQNAPISIFKLDIVKRVVMYKWSKIWKPRYMKQLCQNFTFLYVFMIYALFIADARTLAEQTEWKKICSAMLLSSASLFGVQKLIEKKKQITTLVEDGLAQGHGWKWGLRYHFLSLWNWIELSLIILLVILLPLFHSLALYGNDVEEALSASVAIGSVLFTLKMWHFVQSLEGTSSVVLMVNSTVKDSYPFLTLVMIVMMGFAVALHVLFRHADAESESGKEELAAFGTFAKSLATTFYAMLGNFDPELFILAGKLSWLIVTLSVMYLVTQMIVLVNLLIASMGDTFDKIMSTEDDELCLARAKFIDFSEATLSASEIEEMNKLIGAYVYVLMPLDGEPKREPNRKWRGRMKSLENSFKTSIMDSEQRLHELIRQQDVKLEEMIQRNNEQFEIIKSLLEHQGNT